MKRFAPTALMLGNFVTGTSVIAPAGMLPELAQGLGVTVHEAGFLITFGAVVLCIGSPAMAWLTSRYDRRLLLSGTVAIMAAAQFVSAWLPDYGALLAVRRVMLAFAALYTPQAAGTAALMVPPERRGGTMSYVFLGWSLAIAVGLPLVTYVASHFGWRIVFVGLGVIATINVVLLLWRVPPGLRGAPVELATWVEVMRNPLIVMLLVITVLQTSGQFAVFTYFGPLLKHLGGATPELIALAFATYGVTGFIGNVIASRIVDRWGAYRTSLMMILSMLAGVVMWAVGAGVLPAMLAAMIPWGFGFASTNSMQQVRLAAAAPQFASATVSLNTSALYVGQAIGSGIGGLFFAHEMYFAAGYVSVGFLTLALLGVIRSRRLESLSDR